MIAADVATRVREVINDPMKVRWSDAELCRWISDGQLFIITYRPDATASTTTLTLVEGTKQTLPTNAVRLLDVVRAVKQDGTPGGALRYIDRDLLDSQDPNWHSAAKTYVVTNIVYDNRVPREFYCYPPAIDGAAIDVSLCLLPTNVAALGDALTIADIYREALTSYVTARCYSKDTEARTDRALVHMQALSQSLGIKLQKDIAFQPDLNNKGGSPNATSISMGGV